MASYTEAETGRSVSIGRVISRTVAAFGSNPGTIFGIAVIFGALPQTVLSYGSQTLRLSQTRWEVATSVSGVSGLLMFVLGMLAQGALVRATVAASQGRKASFGESATAGLSVALPLVGLAILAVLAIALGFALFVVPGVMLAMAWAVIAPALVEERLGIFEAFGRSADLTKGARWKILGLLLLVWVCYTLFLSVFGVTLIAGGMRGMTTISTGGLTVGWLVFNLLLNTLVSAIWGVLQTSLYIELRDWKDGPTTDSLQEIFA
jgi:hypothetical protein